MRLLQFYNILFVELLKLCGVDGNGDFKREHFQFMASAFAAFIWSFSTVASSLLFSPRHLGNGCCMHSVDYSTVKPCNLPQADWKLCYSIFFLFFMIDLILLWEGYSVCCRFFFFFFSILPWFILMCCLHNESFTRKVTAAMVALVVPSKCLNSNLLSHCKQTDVIYMQIIKERQRYVKTAAVNSYEVNSCMCYFLLIYL